MSDPNDRSLPVRRYNDAEVRVLLERAARIQGRAPAPPRAQGLTLAQLEEIAAESQIDVARLREAARELDVERTMQPTGTGARLAGGPLRLHAEHTLPFEVDDSALGVLVSAISSATADIGESRIVGRTFTWYASTKSGRRVEVRAAVHGGTTRITVDERFGELVGGLFGGVLGGVGIGVGVGGGTAIHAALGSVALGVAIPVAVIGGSYAACRFGFGAYVRRRARHISALCDRIAQDLTALHEDAQST